jgi:hydrogenase 3 maturation protease
MEGKKMSRSSWSASLKKTLALLKANKLAPRLAILGIGNELWGDDGAGVQLARRLLRTAGIAENLLIVDAGPLPENQSGLLRRFQPDFVLLVDALRPDTHPGQIVWTDLSDLDGISAFTHGLPLSVFAEFLRQELGCTVGLLGIEGIDFSFDQPLSLVVRKSIRKICLEIMKQL